MVECQLPKLNVDGSIPFARSNPKPRHPRFRGLFAQGAAQGPGRAGCHPIEKIKSHPPEESGVQGDRPRLSGPLGSPGTRQVPIRGWWARGMNFKEFQRWTPNVATDPFFTLTIQYSWTTF